MVRSVTDLRVQNIRRVLQHLLAAGPSSRADLARCLGLSKPTISDIAAELIRRSLVKESVTQSADRERPPGRPSTPLELDRRQPRFILVQIGVHETRLAAVPLQTDGVDRWPLTVSTPDSADAFRNALAAAAKRLSAGDALGVIISVPGLVNEPEGRVVFSPNLRWLADASLVPVSQSIWRLPVVLMQEIRALALGHHLATGDDDFLLIDISDGLGGAAVIRGGLYTPPLPVAMEIGHTQIVGQHRPCGCGGTGCLETLFSHSGLLRAWAGHSDRPFERWADLANHLAQHPRLDTAWAEPTLDAAGSVIGGALNMVGVQRVVFTGAANELPEPLQQRLAGLVREHSLWGRLQRIDCCFAPRHRMRGMVATGIDHLVAPLADSVVHQVIA